jgi:predicted O-methyltransferase YrrM
MIKRFFKLAHPKFQKLILEYPVSFEPRYGHGQPAHPQLLSIIENGKDEYEKWLHSSLKYTEHFQAIKNNTEKPTAQEPFWNNLFLPGLDMVMLYTAISELKPKRYVEIGSGNSTKVAHKAITEQGLKTEIISIDPMPRAEIDALANTIIRSPFEDSNFDFLEELEENDILFVDNSHRVFPNSDATVFFLEVLPRLKKGVVVQIHDVYLPFDYPQFMCDRFYSEQYMLAAFLLANSEKYAPMIPNYYLSENKELSQIIEPIWSAIPHVVEKHGGSFWLKIEK